MSIPEAPYGRINNSKQLGVIIFYDISLYSYIINSELFLIPFAHKICVDIKSKSWSHLTPKCKRWAKIDMQCRLSQTYQLSRIQLTKTKLRLSISALQLAPWYGSVILLLNDNYANLMLDHWRRSKEFMDIKRFGNKSLIKRGSQLWLFMQTKGRLQKNY